MTALSLSRRGDGRERAKMAIALFKAISAIGLKTTGFLQSLLPSPFNALLQAAQRFATASAQANREPGHGHQPSLPSCPPSSSASASTPPAATREEEEEEEGGGGRGGGGQGGQGGREGRGGRRADQTPTTGNRDGGDNDVSARRDSKTTSTADMTTTASSPAPAPSQPPASSASKPDPARKEDYPPAPPPNSAVDTDLSNGLARVDLGSSGGGGGSTTTTTTTNTASTTITAANALAGNGEVVRALPVPLKHAVSQTSRPKEAAAAAAAAAGQGDAVTVQAVVETPEQAAERAMHSRFMREALDMVSSSLSRASHTNGKTQLTLGRPDLLSGPTRRPLGACLCTRGE